MSLIDVSELMHDPDFVDRIQMISRVSKIDGQGQNNLEECIVNTVGSVQPISGKALQRLPDALRVGNISSFWFQGDIVTSEPGKYSSILVFKGKRYQVQTVFDWTAWSAG